MVDDLFFFFFSHSLKFASNGLKTALMGTRNQSSYPPLKFLSEALCRGKQHVEPTPTVVVEDEKTFPEQEIFGCVSDHYLRKTQILVNFIRLNSSVGWNESREVIFDDEPSGTATSKS